MTVAARFSTGFCVENGEVLGLSLGFTHSSSHEHGISPVLMQRLYGEKEDGLCEKELRLFVYNDGQEALLMLDSLYELTCEMKGWEVDYTKYFEKLCERYCGAQIITSDFDKEIRDTDVDCVWDANQLAVRVKGAEKVKMLQDLYEKLIKTGFVTQNPGFRADVNDPRFGLMVKMPQKH